jgi:hypothetical protein
LQNADPREQKREKKSRKSCLKSRDVLFRGLEASSGVYRGIKTKKKYNEIFKI